MKLKKRRNIITTTGIIIFSVAVISLFMWKHDAEDEANHTPEYARINLEELLELDILTEEHYKLLFMQTGLGKPAVDYLWINDRRKILDVQEYFFHKPEIMCEMNSIISWQESIKSNERYTCHIVGIEDGDILISPCSHVFGWRNGHAALVVDADNGKVLESVVLGEDSVVSSIEHWKDFPSFIVLRVRGITEEEREMIVDYALNNLNGLRYGFIGDIFQNDVEKGEVFSTHCAHLVWRAYMEGGYNLDSDGGIVVTPRDIAESPLLEIVQVYGMELDD